MKKYLLFISAFCAWPLLSVAQNDVYYIPSKQVNEVTVTNREVPANEDEQEPNYVIHHNNSNRDIDEYNRRGSYSKSSDADSIDPELQSQVEDDNDYSSTKMIVRFHAPVASIIVSSPYYWDICYGNTWDSYYDDWAFGLPSWSYWSYAYDPWFYNRWWYRTCWDYTWGWYDPWWGSNYWGWGRPIYWGWDRPYYGGWGGRDYCDGWGGHGGFAPGFDHMAGGGRQMMANTSSITRGSAGGFIRQGGSNYRSMYAQGGNQNYSTLSKSFRMNGLDGRSNNSAVRSGGGFSRSNSNYYSRSNSYQNQSNSRSSNYNYTPSRTTTQQSMPSSPSRSYGSSSPSSGGGFSSGGGGGFSSGGGGRSGGGGFSRGGGGGGGRR